MKQSIPFSKQCVYPGCQGAKWEARRLEVCGGHAREILTAMEPEVIVRSEMIAARTRDTHINQLQTLVREQDSTIRQLRGEAPEVAAPPRPVDGVVYYLRSGGYIKIGWTSDLVKRMRAYGPDSVLLATEPGTRKDENKRHKMFAAHRTHGREWYAMVPALMHHVDMIVKQHGQPDTVTFAAQPVTIPQPRPKQYVGGNYRGPGTRGIYQL